MPKFLLNRWHGLHIVFGLILMILLIVAFFFYEWKLGITGLILCGALTYYTLIAEKAFRKELNDYVATLSHRVKRAANEVINELPIGIVLYNEEHVIEWHNPFVGKMLERDSLIGIPLMELLPMLRNLKDKDGKMNISLGNQTYQIMIKAEERLLYFTNISAYTNLVKQHDEEKPALGLVMMDNMDEVTQGMDDQSRSIMMAKVTGEITEWASKNNLYLRRITADKFLIILDQKSLRSLEQTRFGILDEVRDLTIEYKLPLTLSIGVASGVESLIKLGHLAQTSLDIALGRGGDQAAVKVGQRLAFYGGRSNAVEKRTRVRARVISHALRDLIKESDRVVIMGHLNPDMDAIGAAIGVLKATQISNKDAYIVLDGVNPSIYHLMEQINDHENLKKWFITPDQALHMTNQRTLVVVVDTHRASMVVEPRILQQTHRIVIVDHHRRGEEFIDDAILVYLEPYASSTCELVTELLQYIHERISLDVLEATALLAGIVVDTKSFSLRTGARTFEAASFLRRNGADSNLIQRMLKEDLKEFIKKAEVIKHAEIIYNHIALAVSEPNRKHSQLLIAQVADTLLNMTDMVASFVVSERTDGLISISARSLGQINVQVVMERLGGGGHLTNAAAQLEGTLEEATAKLKQVLKEMDEEEGLFE